MSILLAGAAPTGQKCFYPDFSGIYSRIRMGWSRTFSYFWNRALVDCDRFREIVLTAEFTRFQEVDVMVKVSGYVKTIGVDVGDHIRQGRVLATI